MGLDVRLLAVVLTGALTMAWANTEEAEGSEEAPPTSPRDSGASQVPQGRFRCRAFPVDVDAVLDTRDRASELGRWSMEMEARGWRVSGVDFEVAQKPTGYAQAYAQVCVTPLLLPEH